MDEVQKRRALLAIMLSIFLAAMESTVVATAMPKVVASLGGIHIYSWVFSGFLLTSTVTMPLWGRLSDLFGRRSTYLAGLTIFLLGSALSGTSQNMAELIAFRMLQGLGAGSLMTIGMTIVGDLFGLERRAKMQGYLSSVWGVASLVGPLLGGLLTDYVSWRWVFYINLPFGALGMILIATALGEEGRPRRRPAIDYGGLALFALSVSALLLGVVEAGREGAWTRPDVVAALAVGGLALAAFVAVERRAREPIVPLRLFANRIVAAAVVTGFLAGMAMFGAISFVPLFMQAVVGTSATQAGFVLTPFVLGWVALSVLSARLVLKIGYRTVVTAGMACLTGAFLLLTRWNVALTPGEAMRDVLLAGVGMGLSMVPMLIAVQSSVPRTDLGIATSMTQFFRAVGGALGLSVMGAVMTRRLAAGLGMEAALHGAFVVGLIVCIAALASAFLVPAGNARDLARADMRGEPTRAGG
ncbi:MAG TPA: MDR family MFS transporter [Methylomirabilota bacterium]|jgi:EmrB/QacA subfamily drug resistance transporter|nr:MDR family MFS transporter [Methylomirabilota bacterium]